MLTDFEYRVWTQYLLSADDFGVMRMSSMTLHDQNDALARRPLKSIDKVLENLVAVRLLRGFEHQRRQYLFQHDWQEWQKVTYPRLTLEPQPPLDRCSRHTQWLLSHWPGGKPLSGWKAPEHYVSAVLTDLGKVSETLSGNGQEPLAIAVCRVPVAVHQSQPAAAFGPHDLLDLWNQAAEHAGLSPCLELTDDRLTHARARLKDKPERSYWERVIGKIAASPGCAGKNDRQWVADIDFLLRKGTHIKALEGKYDHWGVEARTNGKPAVGHRSLVPDDEPL